MAARYRDELRAEIVTTGDILRAAIDRVIGVVHRVVPLNPGQHAALGDVMAWEKERVNQWWAARTRTEARYFQEYAEAVESGQLIVNPDALVCPALVAELDARGWTGPYEPVPRQTVSAQPAQEGDQAHALPKVRLRLPGELNDRLTRACHWEDHARDDQPSPDDVLRTAIARVIASATGPDPARPAADTGS